MPETTPKTTRDRTEHLIELINPLILPLGYEVVYLETVTHHREHKTLRLFIDFAQASKQAIGIEDCVKVTRAIDEPLDQIPELDELLNEIFRGPYELEVSSPGVDRPLRLEKDFERFSGQEARIHLFRPLSAEEIENAAYQAKNPKQKNFVGTLLGVKRENSNSKVRLGISSGPAEKPGKKGKTKPAKPATNSVEEVTIPLPLISKANLEPKFDEFPPEKSASKAGAEPQVHERE